ncbi:hypothetical protein [Kitasatospora sp. CMC57]
MAIRLVTAGETRINDIVISYDTRDLAGVAELTTDGSSWGDSCTVTGTVHTCKRVYMYEGLGNAIGNPVLGAAKDARPGARGILHVTATGPDTAETAKDVEVIVGGPDLRLTPVPPQRVEPGGTAEVRLEITNSGSLPANRVIVAMNGRDGVEFKQRFANCEYSSDPALGGRPASTDVICTVDSTVAPGETVMLDPLQLGITASSSQGYATFHVLANLETEWDTVQIRPKYDLTPGSGPRLTFGRPEAPVGTVGGPNILRDPLGVGYQNHASSANLEKLTVAVGVSTDYVAAAEWAPEADGRSGRLGIQLQNNGPGEIHPPDSGYALSIDLSLPKGAKATGVPDHCAVTGGSDDTRAYYTCSLAGLLPGYNGGTFPFAVELAPEAAGATAEVSLRSRPATGGPGQPAGLTPWDPDPGNDSVTVRLGETSGGAAPTTSPGPSGDSTATSRAPGSLGSTGGGGGAGPLIGAGIAVILLGCGVIVLTLRRRRAGTHP